ncbi:MAG: hypothetical protein M3O70_28350 [Actinomycetota bacterium]|nr:hypothetical protein [Actinomycetota bacterium]
MKGRLVWLLAALGTIFVLSALLLLGPSVFPGLLIELGAALLLFAPLLWLERRVEASVEDIRTSTEGSVSQLQDDLERVRQEVTTLRDLTDATRAAIEEQHEQEASNFAAYETQPSASTLNALLMRARGLEAISQRGLRVPILGSDAMLRVGRGALDTTSSKVILLLEHWDGDIFATIEWTAEMSVIEVTKAVAFHLQVAGRYPGDQHYDPAATFTEILRVLRFAIGARQRTVNAPDLGGLIELCNDECALTEYGLENLRKPYSIRWPEITRLRSHVLSKPWVDGDKFDEAATTAEQLMKTTP